MGIAYNKNTESPQCKHDDIVFYGTRSELYAYINDNFGFTFTETIIYNPQKKDNCPAVSELELTFKMCSNEAVYQYLRNGFRDKLRCDFTWKHPVFGKNEKGDKKIVGYILIGGTNI